MDNIVKNKLLKNDICYHHYRNIDNSNILIAFNNIDDGDKLNIYAFNNTSKAKIAFIFIDGFCVDENFKDSMENICFMLTNNMIPILVISIDNIISYIHDITIAHQRLYAIVQFINDKLYNCGMNYIFTPSNNNIIFTGGDYKYGFTIKTFVDHYMQIKPSIFNNIEINPIDLFWHDHYCDYNELIDDNHNQYNSDTYFTKYIYTPINLLFQATKTLNPKKCENLIDLMHIPIQLDSSNHILEQWLPLMDILHKVLMNHIT